MFFALIRRLSFRFFVRQYFERSTGDDTTATILGYASKLIAYKIENGTWQRKYALTSKMKTIFKNLGYDEAKIDEFLKTEAKDV